MIIIARPAGRQPHRGNGRDPVACVAGMQSHVDGSTVVIVTRRCVGRFPRPDPPRHVLVCSRTE
jgi:hypothetical protein